MDLDLKEIKNKAEDLSCQTEVFANLCEFICFGADYCICGGVHDSENSEENDTGTKQQLFYSILKIICQEAKRIEKRTEDLYAKIFKM